MRRDLEVLARYAFDTPPGDFFSVQICDKTVVIADPKPCGIASRFLCQVESDACVERRALIVECCALIVELRALILDLHQKDQKSIFY